MGFSEARHDAELWLEWIRYEEAWGEWCASSSHISTALSAVGQSNGLVGCGQGRGGGALLSGDACAGIAGRVHLDARCGALRQLESSPCCSKLTKEQRFSFLGTRGESSLPSPLSPLVAKAVTGSRSLCGAPDAPAATPHKSARLDQPATEMSHRNKPRTVKRRPSVIFSMRLASLPAHWHGKGTLTGPVQFGYAKHLRTQNMRMGRDGREKGGGRTCGS